MTAHVGLTIDSEQAKFSDLQDFVMGQDLRIRKQTPRLLHSGKEAHTTYRALRRPHGR